METWFTADSHVGHSKIIEYCKRPFTSIEEMDEALIANWNARVKYGDTVYHLGDVAFCQTSRLRGILRRLNGEKHLIAGNHDKAARQLPDEWASIADYREITIGKQRIVLCHYAFAVFNGSHRGTINLHGHSHGSLPGHRQRLDVGVDCWNYAPVNLEEIQQRLRTLPEFGPIDYHGRS